MCSKYHQPETALTRHQDVQVVLDVKEAWGNGVVAEHLSPTRPWSRYGLADHVEELRRRQGGLIRLLPWSVADPRLVEALALLSAAVTDLIEDYNDMTHRDALPQPRARSFRAAPDV